MSAIAIGLNLMLAGLLAAALMMGFRLNGRLKALRESHEGFAKAVAELDAKGMNDPAGQAIMVKFQNTLDPNSVVREGEYARRLGYRAKSLVSAAHAQALNAVFTPQEAAIAQARRIVEAFETAQAQGEGGVELDGNLIELPTYLNARRLLARAEAFASLARRT